MPRANWINQNCPNTGPQFIFYSGGLDFGQTWASSCLFSLPSADVALLWPALGFIPWGMWAGCTCLIQFCNLRTEFGWNAFTSIKYIAMTFFCKDVYVPEVKKHNYLNLLLLSSSIKCFQSFASWPNTCKSNNSPLSRSCTLSWLCHTLHYTWYTGQTSAC